MHSATGFLLGTSGHKARRRREGGMMMDPELWYFGIVYLGIYPIRSYSGYSRGRLPDIGVYLENALRSP